MGFLKKKAASGLFKRLQVAGVPMDLAYPIMYANYPDESDAEIICSAPVVPPRAAWGITESLLKGDRSINDTFTVLYGMSPDDYVTKLYE